ncbi:pyrroline-5-carboxylate reductase [bacterium]|nr:pyrroline-5-carboxylate reductase [bacterium]
MVNKLGVIGFGNMGKALIEGIIEKKVVKKNKIIVSDKDKKKLKNAEKLGVKTGKNREVAEKSDIIILAVKPDQIKYVLSEIKDVLNEKKILISIAAGISTKKIEKTIEKKIPVIRVMPNLNVKVKEGIIFYCPGKYGKGFEREIEKLFSPVGIVLKEKENLFDTITAISGSGPGFIFYFAEQFKKVCMEKGFGRKKANLIASYLIYGSGKMMTETKIEPERLREMVSSPGGTTLAGLSVFEKKNFPEIFRKVIEKAEERSKQLRRENG